MTKLVLAKNEQDGFELDLPTDEFGRDIYNFQKGNQIIWDGEIYVVDSTVWLPIKNNSGFSFKTVIVAHILEGVPELTKNDLLKKQAEGWG